MNDLNRAQLRARYRISGRLVMETALHIGGGRESSTTTDSPVVRDAAGRPFIPGSSLKGAFRAAVERLALTLGLESCQLSDGAGGCASTDESLGDSYQVIRQLLGRELRGEEAQKALLALGHPDWMGRTVTEDILLTLLDEHLCETCKTFGSVHLASGAFFHDLEVEGTWYEAAQIRDGVGIDRDNERAREQVKFDYEVVPAQTAFRFGLTLENPRPRDLALIAVGLQEFMQGMVPLGGIRSRGLGRCRLENVKIEKVDFTDPQSRRKYLTLGEWTDYPVADFIAQHVTGL